MKEIEFGGLLEINLEKELKRGLYPFLVLNFKPNAKILTVGDQKISFNSADLSNVLGIPHTAKPVIEVSKRKVEPNPDQNIIDFWRNYFGLYEDKEDMNKAKKKRFNFVTGTASLKLEKVGDGGIILFIEVNFILFI